MRIAFSLASAPPLVKKKTSMSPGRDLRQLLAQPRARLGGHERIGVGQRRGLLLDRLDDARIAVADVDAHQLAVEVDEALAFGRPEVARPWRARPESDRRRPAPTTPRCGAWSAPPSAHRSSRLLQRIHSGLQVRLDQPQQLVEIARELGEQIRRSLVSRPVSVVDRLARRQATVAIASATACT